VSESERASERARERDREKREEGTGTSLWRPSPIGCRRAPGGVADSDRTRRPSRSCRGGGGGDTLSKPTTPGTGSVGLARFLSKSGSRAHRTRVAAPPTTPPATAWRREPSAPLPQHDARTAPPPLPCPCPCPPTAAPIPSQHAHQLPCTGSPAPAPYISSPIFFYLPTLPHTRYTPFFCTAAAASARSLKTCAPPPTHTYTQSHTAREPHVTRRAARDTVAHPGSPAGCGVRSGRRARACGTGWGMRSRGGGCA
jgi:hypothetical protein